MRDTVERNLVFEWIWRFHLNLTVLTLFLRDGCKCHC